MQSSTTTVSGVTLPTPAGSTAQTGVVATSPWQLSPAIENAWREAQRDLANAVAGLLALGVWLVAYVLPLAVPAVLLFWLAGWALRRWLVDRRQLVSAKVYDRAWIGVGVALVAIAFPRSIGLIVIAVVVMGVLWAASGLMRSFQRRSAFKD